MTSGYRLGVDFGTSSTVAMLAGPDGRVRPLLFDASPLLPSAVFAGSDGALLTGADALRAAVGDPACLEGHPKRVIDHGTVLLGEHELTVVALLTAVLARVAAEAERVAGATPQDVTLGHPASWGAARLAILSAAASGAGWRDVRFVAEPVAAAAAFAAVRPDEPSPGKCLVVYDLGAGTFDVAVLRQQPDGFAVVASGGLPDLGGIDFDAAIVSHLTTTRPDAAWDRMRHPTTAADRRARQTLWTGVRAAKEQLSRHATADIHVPGLDVDVHLTRAEFDEIATPLLDRTATQTLYVLSEAGVGLDEVGAAFLVGGASRIPLAATVLHRALHLAPTVAEQPELAVAEGCLSTPAAPRPAPAQAPPSETAEPRPANAEDPPSETAASGAVLALPSETATSRPPSETAASVPAPSSETADEERPATPRLAVPSSMTIPPRQGNRARRAAIVLPIAALLGGAAWLAWPVEDDRPSTPAAAASSPSAATVPPSITSPASTVPPSITSPTPAAPPTEENLVLTGHFSTERPSPDSHTIPNCDPVFITDEGVSYTTEWVPGGDPPTGRVTVRATRHRGTAPAHTAAQQRQPATMHPAALQFCIWLEPQLDVHEVLRRPK